MRSGASGFVFLLCVGSAASAAAPRLSLDLPAGPLSAAITALVENGGVSIGAPDPRLLAISLPPLHLKGSTATMLAQIARAAGVRLVRTGPEGWQIKRGRPVSPKQVEPEPAVPGEIIVQASKRAERLDQYPAEIVRTSGAELGRYGAPPDTAALTVRVPILLSTDWGAGREKLFLRGVADSSFTGASPALVAQYWGDQPLTYSAPDPDLRLYDIMSVEILAGPQGTLYGAGALGGLIRVEPNVPVLDHVAGSVWSGFTNTAHGANGGDIGGVANVPIVKGRLALRAVGYVAGDPGYIDDVGRGLRNVNRVETRGGRATLRWAIADGWTIDFGGVVQRVDNRDAPYADADRPPLTRSSAFAQPSYNLFLAGSFVVAGRIGALDIRSTTGIVHQSLGATFEASQAGGVSARFEEQSRPELISQELRISGRTSSTSWVIGGSILAIVQHETRGFGRSDPPPMIARLHNLAHDLTGYAEMTRRLARGVSATVGLRYAWTRQSGESIVNIGPFFRLSEVRTRDSSAEDHLLASAGLSYAAARRMTIFTRYEQGFRPGGLIFGGAGGSFTGDHIATLEAGLRHGVAGEDRVAVSLTGAFSRWHHIQADLLDGLGLPEIANIGDGQIYSADASAAIRVAPGLALTGSGFLARSRLDPVPVIAEDGDATTLPNVARNGGTVSLDYRSQRGERHAWQAGIRLQHIGPSLLGVGPALARRQGDYTTMALGWGIRLGAADLTLNLTNLFDSRAPAFSIGTPLAANIERDVTPLKPRTLRLGVRYDF